MTTKEILALQDLNQFAPEDVNMLLGEIFEVSSQNKDIESLKKGLEFSEKQNLENFTDYEKMVFHYFTANGWSYLLKLSVEVNSEEFWQIERVELEKEIIHLRKAISYSEKVSDVFMQSQIYTNLGNVLSHVGRIVEAIDYWNRVKEVNPNFGMGEGNLGFGLVHYAKALYDEAHCFLICRYAYKCLVKAQDDPQVYQDARFSFADMASSLESWYKKEALKKENEFINYSLGNSKREIDYRKWCLQNVLFLNPLNDVFNESTVTHDCLFLPTIIAGKDDPPFYHTIYNQLKQEYVTARFHLYTGIVERKSHFADKGNLQIDTLDYSVYSFNVENTKIAFRICYSLFDKIGYFLNNYLRIGLVADKVNFRKIWLEYDKKGRKRNIHPVVANSQNWMLRGLYWLSKDLYERDTDFSEAILPEAKEIATIRNYIEHKSIKVVEIGKTELVDGGLTYQIHRDELEAKTLQLLKLARAALIYLSLAVHISEAKKERSAPVFTAYLPEILEEFKS